MSTNQQIFRPTGHTGFTLIELMIAVAIVAILASIAVPSYLDSVQKSRRADAQTNLMGLAAAMERFYTENGSYSGAAAGGAVTGAPSIFNSTAPTDGGAAVYNLRITAATQTTFIIQAQPIDGGAMNSNGLIQLDSVGVRSWDENDDGDVNDTDENDWDKH